MMRLVQSTAAVTDASTAEVSSRSVAEPDTSRCRALAICLSVFNVSDLAAFASASTSVNLGASTDRLSRFRRDF